MPTVDEDDKRELELYVENTGELYEKKKMILRIMALRLSRKKYKDADAARLWVGWLKRGAAMYHKEIDASRKFPSALVVELSRELAREYAERLRNHEDLGVGVVV